MVLLVGAVDMAGGDGAGAGSVAVERRGAVLWRLRDEAQRRKDLDHFARLDTAPVAHEHSLARRAYQVVLLVIDQHAVLRLDSVLLHEVQHEVLLVLESQDIGLVKDGVEDLKQP